VIRAPAGRSLRFTGGLVGLAAVLSSAGCFSGDEANWASRKQITDAASRCGIPDFQPTRAGTAWAAYVDKDLPDHTAKEDCIYADLAGQGLLATR
jgi:hypothetical protein